MSTHASSDYTFTMITSFQIWYYIMCTMSNPHYSFAEIFIRIHVFLYEILHTELFNKPVYLLVGSGIYECQEEPVEHRINICTHSDLLSRANVTELEILNTYAHVCVTGTAAGQGMSYSEDGTMEHDQPINGYDGLLMVGVADQLVVYG